AEGTHRGGLQARPCAFGVYVGGFGGRQAHVAGLTARRGAPVWGDGAYQGPGEAIRQAAPQAQDMTSRRVHYKNFVDELQKAKNRVKARVRAMRYRGLKKNPQRLCACFALVNLYLHRKRLAVA